MSTEITDADLDIALTGESPQIEPELRHPVGSDVPLIEEADKFDSGKQLAGNKPLVQFLVVSSVVGFFCILGFILFMGFAPQAARETAKNEEKKLEAPAIADEASQMRSRAAFADQKLRIDSASPPSPSPDALIPNRKGQQDDTAKKGDRPKVTPAPVNSTATSPPPPPPRSFTPSSPPRERVVSAPRSFTPSSPPRERVVSAPRSFTPSSPSRERVVSAPRSFTPSELPRPQKVVASPPPQAAPTPALEQFRRVEETPIEPPPTSYPSIDPQQAWQAAADIGSYGGDAILSNSRETSALTTSQDSTPPNEVAYVSDSLSGRIVVGTRARAILETPIVWLAEAPNSDRKFVLKTLDPIKYGNGEVAIPAGSYLVAAIDGGSGEFLSLKIVQAIVDRQGNAFAVDVPPGAATVLGTGGGLLEAKEIRRGGKTSLGLAVLAGIGESTNLLNRPETQVTTSNGFISSTTTNSDPNILAGFASGVAQNIVSQETQRLQQELESANSRQPIFAIAKGKEVEVFINENFYLNF